MDCPNVYSFVEISAAESSFKKFSFSSEVVLFLFLLSLFDGVGFQYSQVLVSFLFSEVFLCFPCLVVLFLLLLHFSLCFLIMLQFEWSSFLIRFPTLPNPWGSFRVHLLYSGWSNEEQHFFIRIYTSFYSFVRGWSFCGLWDRRTEREIRQISILTHNFFSWPLSTSASRPKLLSHRPGMGHRPQLGALSDCELALNRPSLTQLPRASAYII